jgi:hypothetical protein
MTAHQRIDRQKCSVQRLLRACTGTAASFAYADEWKWVLSRNNECDREREKRD